MPLISCPDCDKEVSNKSAKCIHCGCPLRESSLERLIQQRGDHALPAIASLVIPGLGQLIRGHFDKVPFFLASGGLMIYLTVSSPKSAMTFGVMTFLLYVWMIRDAYSSIDRSALTPEQARWSLIRSIPASLGFLFMMAICVLSLFSPPAGTSGVEVLQVVAAIVWGLFGVIWGGYEIFAGIRAVRTGTPRARAAGTGRRAAR